MDLARLVRDEIAALLTSSRPALLHRRQLLESSQSIAANIREAYGRRAGPERNQYLRVSRSSVEESDEHLRANYSARLLPGKVYWPLQRRLSILHRMLCKLMGE